MFLIKIRTVSERSSLTLNTTSWKVTQAIRRRTPIMDPVRRKILKTGAAVTAMAAAPSVFGQQTGKGAGKFYEKGPVKIHYEETGTGFPLMLITGGGLSSTIAGLSTAGNPFDPIKEFKGE